MKTVAPPVAHPAQPAGELWFRGKIRGFFSGGPYCGKTRTISVAKGMYDFVTFETSDALKKFSRAAEALEYIRRGEIVPFELVSLALSEEVQGLQDGVTAIALGFPRDFDQAKFAITLGLPIAYVNTPIETCAIRAHHRLLEIQRGEGSNDLLRSGREDEGDIDTLKRRFGAFCMSTLPGIDFCRQAGLVRDIDGSLEPMERALRFGEIFDLARMK